MNLFAMPELKIGNKTAAIPIIQGGMGVGISLSRLASSVSSEGGIGVIAANAIGMIEPDYFKNSIEANIRALRNEIRKARELSSGLIGVNLMVAANDFQELMAVILEEKPDLIFLGAGLPIKGIPVSDLRAANIMVVPIVSTERAANLIFKSWQKRFDDIPDAVVVEGPKAGGHLGFKEEEINDPNCCLESILPRVVDTIKIYEGKFQRKIPVIAAGGIYDGKDIYKLLKLGASGVQLGTRFVATTECDADTRFKEEYVNSKVDDLVIIQSPVGMLGRAINNDFLKRVKNKTLEFAKCPWKCLETCNIESAGYCISIALNNARVGNLDEGYAFAGANAYRVKKISSVYELLSELKEEYTQAIHSEFQNARANFESMSKGIAGIKAECDELVTSFMSKCDQQVKAILNGSFVNMDDTDGKAEMRISSLLESSQNSLLALKDEYQKVLESLEDLPKTLLSSHNISPNLI